MFLALILLLVAIGIGQLAGGYYVYSKINRTYNEISQGLKDIFVCPGEDGLSTFGQIINSTADVFSQKIGTSTQAAIRGSIGGTMKGVNAALENEAMAENPNLAVLQALPKSLKGNPIALMGLQAIISRIGQGPASQGNNGHNAQAKFTL